VGGDRQRCDRLALSGHAQILEYVPMKLVRALLDEAEAYRVSLNDARSGFVSDFYGQWSSVECRERYALLAVGLPLSLRQIRLKARIGPSNSQEVDSRIASIHSLTSSPS
jgi:hypothetical protein